MSEDFDALLSEAKELHNALMRMEPVTRDSLPKCNFGGVYLLSEDSNHLYVGRAKNIRKRILQHTRPSVKDAPLAFRLARDLTGRKASYRTKDGRKELLENSEFAGAYRAQKERVARMSIRYVKAEKEYVQALLEIYTANATGARCNEFKTT